MRTLITVLLTVLLVSSAGPATALDLVHDDGTFESLESHGPNYADVVDFTLPGADPFELRKVKVYLWGMGSGTFPVAVRVWDRDLKEVAAVPASVDFSAEGWYDLELGQPRPKLAGGLRVGVILLDPNYSLFIGADATAPARRSYVYDTSSTAWFNASLANFGLRASVEPAAAEAPALRCVGFLPPLHRGPVLLRKGRRTLPLKAKLLDGTGAVVKGSDLAASPVVKVLYAPDADTTPVDVTDRALRTRRPGAGTAFRFTGRERWRYQLRTRGFEDPGWYTVLMGSGDEAEYVVDPTCTAQVVILGPKRRHRR